ncbi:MAG: glycosyl hydrolase family 43, partial [Lachnospiraceae bacterium]|nr:glycosyl hydrolase family 43 [Lachnospiraceae bacterium]
PFPNVTNLGEDRFIGEIEDGTLIGYKYFEFKDLKGLGILARYENDENRVVYEGPIRIDERGTGEIDGEINPVNENDIKECFFDIKINSDGDILGRIYMEDFGNSLSWNLFEADVNIPDGIHALYLIYHGDKKVQLKEIILK